MYFLTNTLLAWDGFFVFAKKAGLKLLFPYREIGRRSLKSTTVSLAANEPPTDWLVHLRLEACGIVDEGNFAGVSHDAQKGVDQYDRPEPPPPPGGARLAFRLPDDDPYPRRCDIRPPFDDGATWHLDITQAPQRTLSVAGIERLPDNLQAVLILDVGQATDLSAGTAISIPADSRTARLIIGERAFTAGEIASALPDQYELHQNFPNPFNPRTSIRFALPKPGHVLLEVYNLLGQKVTTLVQEKLPAGVHTVIWHGIDSEGRQVATGIYFYRIATGDFTDVKKMLLVK
jgi:hypothetical protein